MNIIVKQKEIVIINYRKTEMENTIICSEEETLKLGYYVDKIGVPDVNYKWNKKIHYIDAPIDWFRLTLFMISLGY